MSLDELRDSASDQCWDDEESKGIYFFPTNRRRRLFSLGIGKIDAKLKMGISDRELYQLGSLWCTKSPQSHTGPFRWATDFLVEDGSPVFAARSGKIIETVESNTRWGDDENFRYYLNYVTIQHEDGEMSQYCHLKKDSVSKAGFSLGTYVSKGDRIGLVGKTGWTDRDHLHFLVFRYDENRFGFKSLKPRWSE